MEYAQIRDKAKLYCDGVVSEWIRYASIQLVPRGMDLLIEGQNDKQDSEDNLYGREDSSY